MSAKISELPAGSALAGTEPTVVVQGGVTVQVPTSYHTTLARAGFSANGISLISAADYAAMRGLLDLEPGTDFNAYTANLAALSGMASTGIMQRTGPGAYTTLTLDTDATMAANSDTVIPSQKAVKTAIATAVTGLLDFKGNTDCSANPNYPAASKGDAYAVSVAGKIGGASGKSVDVGDMYIASTDNAGGTEASVGTSWFVLEHNLVGAATAGAITGSGLTMATGKLLGRTTASTGAVEEITPSAAFSFTAGALNLDFATAANFRTGTDATKALNSDKVWDAAEHVALTPGTNVSLDLSTGINFTLAMNGDYTLDNPTNPKKGQTGCIECTQDGTGTQTLAFGSDYRFAGGTNVVLSTAAGTVDFLFYYVDANLKTFISAQKAIAA